MILDKVSGETQVSREQTVLATNESDLTHSILACKDAEGVTLLILPRCPSKE